MKLWLDCDPGFDDWMAVLLLDSLVRESATSNASDGDVVNLGPHPLPQSLQSSLYSTPQSSPHRLQWLGCNVVAGNAPIERVWNNAVAIWKHYGLTIPLFKSELTDSAQTSAQHVLGASGMKTSGQELPLALLDENAGLVQNAGQPQSKRVLGACQALLNALSNSDDQLTIVCIGPLTHVAVVLEQAPHLKAKVAQIILMGGSTDRGNQTPAAEFNIAADPHSADYVFRSGIPIVMLGLNVCRQMQVTQQHVQVFTNLSMQPAQWFGGYFDAYQKIRSADGSVPMPLYDPIVVAYLKNPAWFKLQSARVDIELQGEFTRGMTVVDFKIAQLPSVRPANALVALEVDGQAALSWMMETLVQRFVSQVVDLK
jgi:purine nucleosidase